MTKGAQGVERKGSLRKSQPVPLGLAVNGYTAPLRPRGLAACHDGGSPCRRKRVTVQFGQHPLRQGVPALGKASAAKEGLS